MDDDDDENKDAEMVDNEDEEMEEEDNDEDFGEDDDYDVDDEDFDEDDDDDDDDFDEDDDDMMMDPTLIESGTTAAAAAFASLGPSTNDSTLLQAFLAQMPPAMAAVDDDDDDDININNNMNQNGLVERTAAEHWHDFRSSLPRSPPVASSTTPRVFKITDACVERYGLSSSTNAGGWVDEVIQSIEAATGITHVILGDVVLELLANRTSTLTTNSHNNSHRGESVATTSEQSRVLASIFRTHHASITYVKLGSDHPTETRTKTTALETSNLLSILLQYPLTALTEIEIRAFSLVVTTNTNDKNPNDNNDVQRLAAILFASKNTLKQINLLGIDLVVMRNNNNTDNPTNVRMGANNNEGWLDPILHAVRQSPTVDELRLVALPGTRLNQDGRVCTKNRPSSSLWISSTALSEMLFVKKKWWRLAMDGMQLDDSHCFVVAEQFGRKDDKCKIGDLLSLVNNPRISQKGYERLFAVFFGKQRMGLIKVDDKRWERQFNLVRSMNNLHGRLNYVGDNGTFQSRKKWIDWLNKLNNLEWEDDLHKLNYLWFSILEHPAFVRG